MGHLLVMNSKSCISVLLSLLLPLVALSDDSANTAEKSPWSFEFSPSRGFSLAYDEIPVIRQSTLYVVEPGWTGVRYNQEQTDHEIDRDAAGRVLSVEGENDTFASRYRFEAVDDTTFRIQFHGTLRRDVEAELEYAIGYFNADLLARRAFSAETESETLEGYVRDFPESSDAHANDLAPNFRNLEIDSRLGTLSLEVDAGNERVLFFDARRSAQGWARHAPVFWCGLGLPARPLTYGEPFEVEMTITIDPADLAAPEDEGEFTVSSEPAPAGQSQRDRPIRIIPTPKHAELKDEGGFLLKDGVRWSVSAPESDEPLLDATESLLKNQGLEPRSRRARSGDNVVIRINDRRTHGRAPIIEGSPEWLDNPEGYRLKVDSEGIEIVSATHRGAYYGLQTLGQILRPRDDGTLARAGLIEDWPALGWRGVHWFPSAAGVPFHETLTENIFGRYKFNHTVIQCEAAVWDSAPEIADPRSIEKDDLRHLVELSRSRYLEPIPLINVPGHAEWIFRHGHNMDIVEDPDTPYAYCVNHPGSYEFIKPILSEAIEIFEPETFHLGHDEVTMRGEFPHPDCPRCQDETATDLVLKHLHRLTGWLEEREIQTMIWGDMMLAHEEIPDTAAFAPNVEEARKRRAGMPDDVIITDWHYYEGSEYPSLDLFHQEGHPTIASTWHRPQNIQHFTRAAIENGSLGLLQTTWAGFFPAEGVLNDGLHQFSAFILAAEYAWTGREDAPSALPFEPGTEFTRAYYGIGTDELPGRTVDLSPAARTPRADWLEMGEGWDFRDLPAGEQRLDDILFRIPEQTMVVIGGALAPETAWKSVRFDLDADADKLALLNAAAYGSPDGTIAARMTVRYEDGSTVQEDLAIGRTTAHWGQDTPALRSPVAWQKSSPAGTPVTLRLTRWRNPHPEKTIASVAFDTGAAEQAWALAGLTLLSNPDTEENR